MELDLSRIILTIINFIILIGVIVIIIKFMKSVASNSRRNSNIEGKLDRIIKLLEKEQGNK